MKIIHTSDWHLGQELYSFDRTEEHIAFLMQLKDIVAIEKADVLVISGDIYHIASPSNTVMRIFNDYLDQIRRACPSMQIVVIAGNHDSSARLEVSRTLWGHLGVSVVGKIEKENDEILFDRHIIPVVSSTGTIQGYVVALPYIPRHGYPTINPNTPRDERQACFMELLSQKVEQKNVEHLPVVMMAHMAISGSDITGHDLIQGGMEYTNTSELKVSYDYLALGHIHCPQVIPNSSATSSIARYCGSPIPVSFDENYVHSVTVVEIDKHSSQPRFRTIPIKNPWPLRTIPKDAVEFDEALKILECIPTDEQCYVRLHVKLADVPPQNAMERAAAIVKDKKCRFCCFKWERTGQEDVKRRTFADVDHLRAQSPLDIANLYYSNKYGQPLDEELQTMLEKVIQDVENAHK